MVLATASFAAAEGLLQKVFDGGEVTSLTALVTIGAFLLLSIGGYLGGTIVFEYGMRVTGNTEDIATAEAVKPKWPPFKGA